MSIECPVVFIVYNRPHLTARVFERIAYIRPQELFIVADAPRTKADIPLCIKTREIATNIRWNCRLHKNFANIHLGCARRVATGIDWVFSVTDRAIILEDDCFPALDFFSLCQELLERYCEDTRIMHISGNNILPSHLSYNADYFFSRFCLPPWGWATWRRAWKFYQFDMAFWCRNPTFAHEFISEPYRASWDSLLEGNAKNLYTWDLQWNLDLWREGGLAIVPSRNLVSNLGFQTGATHTNIPESPFSEIPLCSLSWPLRHPSSWLLDKDNHAEYHIMKLIQSVRSASLSIKKGDTPSPRPV